MSTCRYRVLVVDDDPALLRLLAMRLSAVGYEVAAAESGEKAIAQVPTFQPNLVITDLRMDGMDGMALYKKAIENGVAFVPGKYFYTQPGEGIETMRLNFTMTDEKTIDLAVCTLAEVIKQEV